MTNLEKKVLIVSGPTATGKTSLAVELAHRLRDNWNQGVEIVNFDSLSFYQELSIGTARPSSKEQRGIVHHLMGIISIADEFNAADFVGRARTIVKSIHNQGNIPLLVGGSGFYLRALIKGMWPSKAPSEIHRQRVQKVYDEEGIEGIMGILRKGDEQILENIHPHDHYRLQRAAEHLLTTGNKFSLAKAKGPKEPYNFAKDLAYNWKLVHIFLDMPKEKHQRAICQRVEKMLTEGLLAEVEELLNKGFNKGTKALGSVGYKEAIAYLTGMIRREELKEKIVVATRQLAKAQRTFFKKIYPKMVFSPDSIDCIEKTVARNWWPKKD